VPLNKKYHLLKKLVCVIACLLSISCTHNYSPKTYRTTSKTAPLISLSTNNDTLTLGDTLAVQFNLSNPVTLDDGSQVNISSVEKTGFAYNFDKSWADKLSPRFYLSPKIVEAVESSLQVDGIFSFHALIKPLIGSTIHYVPQDTGTFVIYTGRFQYLLANIEGSKEQVQINLYADFNVPDKHLYLLNPYPSSRKGYEASLNELGVPYYCFYVKNK
jgi:hypothetical protein